MPLAKTHIPKKYRRDGLRFQEYQKTRLRAKRVSRSGQRPLVDKPRHHKTGLFFLRRYRFLGCMNHRPDIIQIHIRFFSQRLECLRLNVLHLRKRHRRLIRQIPLRLSITLLYSIIRDGRFLSGRRMSSMLSRGSRPHTAPYFCGRTLIIPQTIPTKSRPSRYRLERDTDRDTARGTSSWKHLPLNDRFRGFAGHLVFWHRKRFCSLAHNRRRDG